MRVSRPTREEALRYLTEGFCPICKTEFKKRDGSALMLCARGYTPAQIRFEFNLPDVVRLPRRK
jgi:hypothetical protein